MEQITSWVVANPERSSGDIFRELQRLSLGRYHPLQIRTHKPRDAENTCLPGSETLRSSGKQKSSMDDRPTSFVSSESRQVFLTAS